MLNQDLDPIYQILASLCKLSFIPFFIFLSTAPKPFTFSKEEPYPDPRPHVLVKEQVCTLMLTQLRWEFK